MPLVWPEYRIERRRRMMFNFFTRRKKLPVDPDPDDLWSLTSQQAIKKYGSAIAVVDQLKNKKPGLMSISAIDTLMIEYMIEHRVEFLELKEKINSLEALVLSMKGKK